ncbi:MAG: hypothetical protein Dasosvirus17_3 [Dasosvirus sp.]|uniref:TM2 domain-containing protein n=1 Tax=Dasosvirus sp. TaxID=2487764 RepID=A0A3G4ZVJ9_9VIRU|nr:MAG: hypothetical protein Dasosvirus17_3 [Dasosvirus sp.]
MQIITLIVLSSLVESVKMIDNLYSKIKQFDSEESKQIVYLHDPKEMNLEELFICIGTSSCSYNGQCDDSGNYCHCYAGYITYQPSSDVQCNYEQKKRSEAFWLEIFFGMVGAGEWYLGNIDIATGQLAMFLGIKVLYGCFYIFIGKNAKTGVSIPYLALGIWIIVDCIYIGTGNRLDGNGAPISGW